MDQKFRVMQLLSARQHGDFAADGEIIEWCGGFVTRWQSRGMTEDDRDEIVNEALVDLMEVAKNQPKIRVKELFQALTRALWRAKKRWQREQDLRSRMAELPDDLSVAAGSENPSERAITGQLLQLVLEKIFLAFESELLQLSERDHDLISRHYRLEARFPPVGPAIRFSTPGAARQAQSRARRRLAQATDDWLERELALHPEDQYVVELAQEVVRGDRILKVVGLLEEIECQTVAADDARKSPVSERGLNRNSVEARNKQRAGEETLAAAASPIQQGASPSHGITSISRVNRWVPRGNPRSVQAPDICLRQDACAIVAVGP